MMKKIKGYTLLELMAVVAIIGILVATAWPNYQTYRVVSNRTVAQVDMIEIAQKMVLYKTSNYTYEGATVAKINNGVTNSPSSGNALYTLEFEESPTSASSWVLIAKPIATAMQKNDGWICLDHQGQKSWKKGTDACNLASASTWRK